MPYLDINETKQTLLAEPPKAKDNVNALEDGAVIARVVAAHRDRYEITCQRGAGFAGLKKSAYNFGDERFPTVGDIVALDWQDNAESRILRTLPRKTCFYRLDPSSSGRAGQAVAANFDCVFILLSLNRDFNLRRLERYLAQAAQSGAEAAVVLTKADLAGDFTRELAAAEKNSPRRKCGAERQRFRGERRHGIRP